MKKIFVAAFIMMSLFFVEVYGAQVDNVEVKSVLQNGTTMVYIEDFAKTFDLEVMERENECALINKDVTPKEMVFSNEKKNAALLRVYTIDEGVKKLLGEESLELKEEIFVNDGKIFIPFRAAAEYFGANVYWNEADGAYAYRTSYGKKVLIRANGSKREVVSYINDFDNVKIRGDKIYYLKGGNLFEKSLATMEERNLGKGGNVHFSKDKVFVFNKGELWNIDLKTGERKDIANSLTIVGYTIEGYAWCETAFGTYIYDTDGKLIEKLQGKIERAWEYIDGKVYFLGEDGALYRSDFDGSNKEKLIKYANYLKWVEGKIYYTDNLGNYRAFDIKTKEDIMVYGLNLEYVSEYKGEYLFNFYGENGNYGMFIGSEDGNNLRSFGTEKMVSGNEPEAYNDGVVILNQADNKLYYSNETETKKLSDDRVLEYCGIYDGYVYYTIK